MRVIRACREMDIASVAVYSEADRLSPHVLMADEAYPIGPAPAKESYLSMDRVLEATDKLVRFSQHLGIPILVTEHYPRGLGDTAADGDRHIVANGSLQDVREGEKGEQPVARIDFYQLQPGSYVPKDILVAEHHPL